MIGQVRGKFLVLSAQKHHGSTGTTIRLGAVSSSDSEKTENCMYSRYTPSGSIEMYVDNPPAEEFFTLGAEVYVDFSKSGK